MTNDIAALDLLAADEPEPLGFGCCCSCCHWTWLDTVLPE